MDYLKKNTSKILLATFCLLGGLYIFFGYRDRQKNLNSENVKYTIGEIIDFNVGARVPYSFTFNFYIGDEKHKSYYEIVDELALTINRQKAESEYLGKKYLVKYSIEKPKYNELYLNKPIPDSLKGCEKCSWSKVPF